MTTTTDDTTLEHRWQAVTTVDGLTVCGSPAGGWRVLGPLNEQLAHLREPGLDALGALDEYRRRRADAERQKTSE